jgi:hypothetical protein
MPRFVFEYDITATIDAETQAEAEAKLLAEPALLDFSDFDDFDVSFRAGRSDNYIRVHPGCAQRRDTKSWEPLSVIHVILTDKTRAWAPATGYAVAGPSGPSFPCCGASAGGLGGAGSLAALAASLASFASAASFFAAAFIAWR